MVNAGRKGKMTGCINWFKAVSRDPNAHSFLIAVSLLIAVEMMFPYL